MILMLLRWYLAYSLSYRDVEVFLHEMGHVMHCLLNDTALYSVASFGVKGDFIEVPSTIFENWMKDLQDGRMPATNMPLLLKTQ